MADGEYKEAQGVGLVAGVMLVFALIAGLTFIWQGLTPHPTAAPPAAATAPASN